MSSLSASAGLNGCMSSAAGLKSSTGGAGAPQGQLSDQRSSEAAGSDSFFSKLNGAATIVRQYLQEDLSSPDLSEHLAATAPGHYRLVLNEINAPVERKRSIAIPDAVIQASTSANSHAAQGLFAEIERAWISIDNNLYLWDYLDGSPDAFEYHRHSDYVIQSVGLVRARKDVVVDTIKHLLVLSTNATVTLFGLALESPKPAPGVASNAAPPRKELKIYGIDMEVATQGITMVDFCSTDSGRLFCRGREDDCLYEIVYQAQESWFRQKCKLVNLTAPTLSNLVPSFLQSRQREPLTMIDVDRERSVLYALYKRTEIEIWNIPADINKPAYKVARATDICRHATNLCPGTNMLPAFDFAIDWLGIISPSESKTLHMVAVTSKGVRIYFSHSRSMYRTTSGGFPSVDCLDVRAVRPPPQPNSVEDAEERSMHSQQSSDVPNQHPATGNLRTAHYAHGVFLAASTLSKDHDTGTDNILYVSRSLARVARPGGSTTLGLPQTSAASSEAAETATDVIHRATTTVISEAPHSSPVPITDASGLRLSPFALQLILPPRQFLVLGSSGLVILSERRPIEVLRSMLDASQAFEHTIVPFFNRYGYSQSCAMLLAIAARNRHVTTSISVEGGGVSSGGTYPYLVSEDAVSNAWRLFFEFGGAPTSLTALRTSQHLSESSVQASSRFEGLSLYLARLLRPFWTSSVTKKAPVPGDPSRQEPAISAAVLTAAQTDLSSLASFLQTNAQFFVLGAQGQRTFATQESEAYAWKVEHDRVDSIRALVSRTLEALSFVLLLIDYQLPAVVAQLKPDRQEQLSKLSFADLITTSQGRDIARALVEAVIDRQISSQVSIDLIADVLQQRCGSFCSAADVQLYKALELVRGAKEARDSTERAALLKDGLDLLLKTTHHLPFDKLQAICADFRELKYAQGAIELPLRCAAAWDPSNVAGTIQLDAPQALLQSHPALSLIEQKNACYALALDMLKSADDGLDAAEQEPEGKEGRATRLRQASVLRDEAYDLALAQDDRLFHWKLYDWLLDRGLTEQLLQVRSPFIIEYLDRPGATSVEKLNLLWQLHRRDERYSSAARVLVVLAEINSEDITLDKRVEYLSLAHTLAKCSYSPETDMVTSIQDQLEVARVQLEVQSWLRQFEPEHEDIISLDESLLDLNTLWSEFAEPYQMNEIKLMMLDVAGLHNLTVARQIWSDIIEAANGDADIEVSERWQAVELRVHEIGKRFMPSDSACPISVLLELLEQYAYNERSRQDIYVGWAPVTLLRTGGNAIEIFESLDSLLSSRDEPWDTKQARFYLLSETAHFLSEWLNYALTNSRTGAGIAVYDFPASRVDDAIGAYLGVATTLASAVAKGEIPVTVDRTLGRITMELKDVQEDIRRKF